MFSFLLASFANLWIYRIIGFNFLLGILLLLTTYFLYKKKKYFFIFFIPLIFFQIKTTDINSLTQISNDDRRVIDLRLKAYPKNLLRLGYWMEERKESIIFRRISENFFENIDVNLYFFANHPRERVGTKEFEKFPYIFLPFFLYGIYIYFKDKSNKYFFIYFLFSLSVLSIIGNKNNLGPFLLFPVISLSIAEGLKKLNKRNLAFLIVLLVLVLIQIISYEIS